MLCKHAFKVRRALKEYSILLSKPSEVEFGLGAERAQVI
ncbi:MAG: hypothetical protein QOH96_270, partial [Blastocatellia bacterium]|nr:hypothetical protein [Blastocatellia bacterium]